MCCTAPNPGHWWSAAEIHQLLPAAFALLVFLRVFAVDSVAGGGGGGGVGLGAVPFSSRTMRRPPRVSLDLASNSTCCCWITALTVVDAAAACCRFERRVGVSDEPGGGVDDSSRDRFSLGCVVSRVPWPGTEVMLTTLTAVVLWFGLLHLKDNVRSLLETKLTNEVFFGIFNCLPICFVTLVADFILCSDVQPT